MRVAIHSGVLATVAQVLEMDQEEFFDSIEENERNFEDLVKCKRMKKILEQFAHKATRK